MTCLNPQLQYEKLHQLKHKYLCIKSVVDCTPIDLYDLVNDTTKIDEFKENLATCDREDIVMTFCDFYKSYTVYNNYRICNKIHIEN
jgi:hypothetical protein